MAPANATRARALAMMEAFKPRMGRQYASGRNHDRGPGRHTTVSCLSPYIRRRLLTEEELVAAAIAMHGAGNAEKFVQEVIWRGYFKGWLERRPSVWRAYRDGLAKDVEALKADIGLSREIQSAETGTTGLACFDAWAGELAETGYLHNHARMWFASIWIFTLKLPWRLGADFFLRHLLDGDPASNTLGWRWVAGLHTRGKAYQAMAWNIAKFTDGRFSPKASDLATEAVPLDVTEPDGVPAASPVRDVSAPEPGRRTALLITEEDCNLEAFDMSGLEICAIATLSSSHLRSDRPVSGLVAEFEAEALADAADRLGATPIQFRADVPDDLAKWARKSGAEQIATPYVPVGPLRDWLGEAASALEAARIPLCEWRRNWDMAIWPHATAGFFKVKKQIPRIVAELEAA